MPTTVIKTIGTAARDYSTLQAWEDATPASLIAVDQVWRGECYNDSEFTAGIVFAGTTADATRRSILTTAAGQSFMDNAGKLTNALHYDQTKGVGVSATNLSNVIFMNEDFVTVSKLQIKQPGLGYRNWPIYCDTGSTNTSNIFDSCIVEGYNNYAVARLTSSGSVIQNCLLLNKSIAASTGMIIGIGAKAYNCTIVQTSDLQGTLGIATSYTGSIVANCAVFGFATPFAASGFDTTNSKNNATDGTSAPGTSNQVSLTYANQFVSTTNAASDFRAKSGNGLQFGVTDTTHTSGLDIVGQTRAATPTIGAWEYVAIAPSGLASTVISGSTSSANLSISVMLSAVAVSGSTSSATLATIPSFTTPQLKNNTGAILASETGVIVNVYNYTTGALVVSLTGLTSNATGYVTVASNSMVSGTQYAYEVVLTAGRRRLPLITAS